MRLHFPHFEPRALLSQEKADAAACTLLALGKQPRGNKLMPLVAEFASYLHSVAPVASQAVAGLLEKQPKGARVVNRWLLDFPQPGTVQQEPPLSDKDFIFLDGLDPSAQPDLKVEVCQIGDPDEFVRRAVLAGHPLAMNFHLGDDVQSAVRMNFHEEPYRLAKLRVAAIAHWTSRAKALQPKEEQLHSSLPEHLKPILKGKRLLLFREMMDAAGCEDPELVSEICQGFSLVGWQSASGHFLPRVRRPEISVETFRALSEGLNSAVMDKARARASRVTLKLPLGRKPKKSLMQAGCG